MLSVHEDLRRAQSVLCVSALVSIPMSLCIRILQPRVADEAAVLIILSVAATVSSTASWWIGIESRHERSRIRNTMLCVTALCGAILGSCAGIRVYRFSVVHAAIWAVGSLCGAWAVSLVCNRIVDSIAGRTHRSQRTGLCVRCGYDLRASKARCPECGETLDASVRCAGSRTRDES